MNQPQAGEFLFYFIFFIINQQAFLLIGIKNEINKDKHIFNEMSNKDDYG